MKTNLLNYDLAGLTAHFAQMGEKPFRARQVMRWMHQGAAGDFDEMTDLAKSLRAKLNESAQVGVPALMAAQESRDGTRKWLLDVGTGNGVETVFIPETDRYAFPRRWAVRWNALSAPPVAKASIATSPPPKSSANYGGRTKHWAPPPKTNV